MASRSSLSSIARAGLWRHRSEPRLLIRPTGAIMIEPTTTTQDQIEPTTTTTQDQIESTATTTTTTTSTTTMPNRYIIVFKSSVTSLRVDEHADLVKKNGGTIKHRYGVLNGFAAEVPEEYLSQLKSLHAAEIDYIEPDGVMTTQ